MLLFYSRDILRILLLISSEDLPKLPMYFNEFFLFLLVLLFLSAASLNSIVMSLRWHLFPCFSTNQPIVSYILLAQIWKIGNLSHVLGSLTLFKAKTTIDNQKMAYETNMCTVLGLPMFRVYSVLSIQYCVPVNFIWLASNILEICLQQKNNFYQK